MFLGAGNSLPASHRDVLRDVVEEEDERGYKWEKMYERSWAGLREDRSGRLQTEADVHEDWLVRKHRAEESLAANIRRGMIRNVFIVLDLSKAMEDNDFRPQRSVFVCNVLRGFVRDFLDQNPISELGLIVTRDRVGEKVVGLTGMVAELVKKLDATLAVQTGGDASLQNALDVAERLLRFSPEYASTEILVVFGALSTCDPGEISETVARLRQRHVRVSVVGFGAELHVLGSVAAQTGGTYVVARSEKHLHDSVQSFCVPPPVLESAKLPPALVRMGFPSRQADETPSFCVCHSKLSSAGYFCPQCKSKACDLPVHCAVCGLMLVSSPHLARSYHHLFPVPAFDGHAGAGGGAAPRSGVCFGCNTRLDGAGAWVQCPRCRNHFCVECDTFIHGTLHNCPGCESVASGVVRS